MKALVTGGHGFIGSFLVERLLKAGFSVRCLVRPTSHLQWIQELPVERVIGDITQPETLVPAVNGVDYVYHVAGAIKAPSREKFFSVNCDGTLHLAEAVRQRVPSLRRFVFISSVAATGPVKGTQTPTEVDPCHPVSHYGWSKLAAEQQLKEKYSELPLTIIRPPIVYGPRDDNFLLFFKFAKRGIFPVPPPYERYYSIVYVKDLVEGIYQASQSPVALGKTYFIANPEIYSFKDLATQMSRPFSKSPVLVKIPKFFIRCAAWGGDLYSYMTKKEVMLSSHKFPELEAASWICSPFEAERDFQFKTETPLSVGLHESVDWLKRHEKL